MNVAKVTVSRTFQIVIPKAIREQCGVKPGDKLLLRVIDGRIQVSLPRPTTEVRGIAKGIHWRPADRDHTERF